MRTRLLDLLTRRLEKRIMSALEDAVVQLDAAFSDGMQGVNDQIASLKRQIEQLQQAVTSGDQRATEAAAQATQDAADAVSDEAAKITAAFDSFRKDDSTPVTPTPEPPPEAP